MSGCLHIDLRKPQHTVIIEKGLPDTQMQGSEQVATGEPIKLTLRRVKRRAKKPRKPKEDDTPDPAATKLSDDFNWKLKKASTRLVKQGIPKSESTVAIHCNHLLF